MLFYGTVEGRKRSLYAANRRPIEVSIFDSFKIGDLAPYMSLEHPSAYAVANLWWLERKKHTAAAWHHKELGTEQVVFLPRQEEHTSELQSLMRNSYAVFRSQKKNNHKHNTK